MPKAPPSIAPRNSDGLNTPPGKPPPSDSAVAAIFAASSAASSQNPYCAWIARSVAS